MDLLPELNLVHLEITLYWRRPNVIPGPILPNVLRGAFGLTFRRLVCPPMWMDRSCKSCALYGECPYGQLFEPTPPPDADRLRKQADLPRPFVLKPPRSLPAAAPARGLKTFVASRRPQPGEQEQEDPELPAPAHGQKGAPEGEDRRQLRFGLVLFGRAINHLPHFLVTLGEMGRAGMGPGRVPFTIQAVDACYADRRVPLYDPQRQQLELPERPITTADLLAGSLADEPGSGTAGEPGRIQVRLLTPTLIRAGSHVTPDGRRVAARELRDQLPFGALVRRLRDRLAALCAFFGSEPWQRDDFAEIGQRADQVQLVACRTRWETRSRQSSRTGQKHELSGLTGTASYQFPTPEHEAEFLPLLRFGQLMHVGKHAVWGNGWLEVEREPA